MYITGEILNPICIWGSVLELKLVKCPVCELNYMASGETMCDVCKAERKKKRKKAEPEMVLCPECNEKPVVPGEEFCADCLREHKRLEAIERIASGRRSIMEDTEEEEMEDILSKEEQDEMEFEQEEEDQIPQEELADMEDELGLAEEEDDEELAL